MTPEFMLHLRRNWPLALVVAGLLLYLPVVLVGGVLVTNQGSVNRSREPDPLLALGCVVARAFPGVSEGPRRLLFCVGPVTTETGA